MNRRVLYQYSSVSKEAQNVVQQYRKADVLTDYHDSTMVSHYGSEETFYRIAKRYY